MSIVGVDNIVSTEIAGVNIVTSDDHVKVDFKAPRKKY